MVTPLAAGDDGRPATSGGVPRAGKRPTQPGGRRLSLPASRRATAGTAGSLAATPPPSLAADSVLTVSSIAESPRPPPPPPPGVLPLPLPLALGRSRASRLNLIDLELSTPPDSAGGSMRPSTSPAPSSIISAGSRVYLQQVSRGSAGSGGDSRGRRRGRSARSPVDGRARSPSTLSPSLPSVRATSPLAGLTRRANRAMIALERAASPLGGLFGGSSDEGSSYGSRGASPPPGLRAERAEGPREHARTFEDALHSLASTLDGHRGPLRAAPMTHALVQQLGRAQTAAAAVEGGGAAARRKRASPFDASASAAYTRRIVQPVANYQSRAVASEISEKLRTLREDEEARKLFVRQADEMAKERMPSSLPHVERNRAEAWATPPPAKLAARRAAARDAALRANAERRASIAEAEEARKAALWQRIERFENLEQIRAEERERQRQASVWVMLAVHARFSSALSRSLRWARHAEARARAHARIQRAVKQIVLVRSVDDFMRKLRVLKGATWRLRLYTRIAIKRRAVSAIGTFLEASSRVPDMRVCLARPRAAVRRLQVWWRGVLGRRTAQLMLLMLQLQMWEARLLGGDERSDAAASAADSGAQGAPAAPAAPGGARAVAAEAAAESASQLSESASAPAASRSASREQAGPRAQVAGSLAPPLRLGQRRWARVLEGSAEHNRLIFVRRMAYTVELSDPDRLAVLRAELLRRRRLHLNHVRGYGTQLWAYDKICEHQRALELARSALIQRTTSREQPRAPGPARARSSRAPAEGGGLDGAAGAPAAAGAAPVDAAACKIQRLWVGVRTRHAVRSFLLDDLQARRAQLGVLDQLDTPALLSLRTHVTGPAAAAPNGRLAQRIIRLPTAVKRLSRAQAAVRSLREQVSASRRRGRARRDSGSSASALAEGDGGAAGGSVGSRSTELPDGQPELLADEQYRAKAKRMQAKVRAHARGREGNLVLIQAHLRGRKHRLKVAIAHRALARPARPYMSLRIDEVQAIRLIHRAQLRAIGEQRRKQLAAGMPNRVQAAFLAQYPVAEDDSSSFVSSKSATAAALSNEAERRRRSAREPRRES